MVNLQYMIIATGTDAAFSDQSKAIITNMALDGTGWMCFNGQNDPASMGRSSSRKTGLRSNMRYVFEQLLKCDPPRREQVLAAIASSAGKAPMPAGNRMFWSSCLMVHQLPDWHLSIKMFSPRVYNSDGPVNTEGLENGYMSHGTAFLTRHGDEYIGLGGAWDWQHLPGSTVALSPTYQGKLKQFNGSDFAGGASDGQLGVAGFELESQGLHARLAWFCFEQGYVVLGSDLRDAANLPIVTTYDQCYRKGPVWTGHKDGSRTQLDDQTSGALSDTTWLWHDKVLYINQGNSTVLLGPLKQKGNWGRINIMYRGEPDVSADVFKAWLQHTDGQFAYTVFPQASLEQVDELVATLPMHIVAHDAKTLAIYNSVDHVGQAIFFAPGKVTFADKLTVAVDQPLAVMVRHTTDATVISLASPSQQTGKTTVTINGVSRTFDLPHGLQKGSTVTVSFK
jgi:chondroitin AC lyase